MPDFRNLTDRLTERGRLAEQESRFGDASDMQDARAEIERLRDALKKRADDRAGGSAITDHPSERAGWKEHLLRTMIDALDRSYNEGLTDAATLCERLSAAPEAEIALYCSNAIRELVRMNGEDRTMIPQGEDQTQVSPDTNSRYIAALADDIERHLQAGGRNFLLGGAQLDWTISALRALVRQRQARGKS